MVKDKRDAIKCSKCGYSMNYVRLVTKQRVCRKCGYVEQMKEGKK